ncbi:MAG: DUF1905 domain-containing protein [Gemmatimonadetes bacterium]|nr:DUF1905 domain-containing protein [Gemmatimonadota bacterium]
MPSRSFNATLVGVNNNSACAIEIPFDPKETFGKVRAPVVVTIRGYSYKSTIARMSGVTFVPLRKSHQVNAGVSAGERVRVKLALDNSKRTVKAPADLEKALESRGVLDGWKKLSFTMQRENVEGIEGAKKPETRARRIERAIDAARGKLR